MSAAHQPDRESDGPLPVLTAQALIRLDYYPAPDALRPFVTTLYALRCDEPVIHDCLPAAVGYLTFNLTGRGLLHFAAGHSEPSRPDMLLTPTTAAVRVELDGPWHMVGAALSPLGWAALTGLHAGASSDRVLDASALFGGEAAELGSHLRAMRAEGDAAAARLVLEFIARRLRPVKACHVEAMAAIGAWLSSSLDPPVAALDGAAGYSPRQLQRLCERYFGVPPRQLARKYRALRVAALLQAPDTTDAQVAALKDLFFDQSHLIRELRHYLGRTPTRLLDGSAPLLAATSNLRGYREIRPNFARIPED